DRTGADPIALEPGDRVGRYVVERPLGAGGMGAVYVARDPELDRPVAPKLVRLAGPPQRRRENAARLRPAARALARLSHPNVVPIYDADAFESGGETAALFIAMELIEGRSLGAWLDSPRTVPEIVDVFVQAARGLAAAHQA